MIFLQILETRQICSENNDFVINSQLRIMYRDGLHEYKWLTENVKLML